MDEPRRQVWRASTLALVLAGVLAVICLLGLPALAVVSWRARQGVLIPALLAVLALVGLGYAWRFGLHPRIVAEAEELVVRNPWRTQRLTWAEVTVVLPGGNGLIVAGPENRAEAWCVQKSERDLRLDRPSRADRIGDELWARWLLHHPPVEFGDVRITRARPGSEVALAELERRASIDRLARIFPGERFPFPIDTVTERWHDFLRDPTKQTFVACPIGEPDRPVGYVAHSANAVLHLAVEPEVQARGYDAFLLRCAEREIFADPSLAEASLWALEDDQRAFGLYSDHGWRDTDNRRRSPYPPKPPEVRMIKSNPRAARRTRAATR